MSVGLAILISWGLYASAWSDVSPAGLLLLLDVHADHIDVWSISDLILSVVVLSIAFEYRWGWLLWSIIVVQIGLHLQYQMGVWEWVAYETALDATFLAKLGVLFWLGRSGCERVLSDWGARIRGDRNAHQAKAP